MVSAQRTAAWADVARRIAHEIKNPLTPIQLSAERLKRRFTKEISSDPETFAQCADTIVRHVSDIGRMVDEFSAFARMPLPSIRAEDVGRVTREALVFHYMDDLDSKLAAVRAALAAPGGEEEWSVYSSALGRKFLRMDEYLKEKGPEKIGRPHV